MNAILLTSLLTFIPAAIQTPCFKQVDGKWKQEQSSQCVQYGAKEQRELTKRLQQWSDIKKETKALRNKIQSFEKLEALWKKMEDLSERTIARHQTIIKLEQKRVKDYKDAFIEQQKLTKRQWYESPTLWLTVGIVVGVGGTTLIVYLTKKD